MSTYVPQGPRGPVVGIPDNGNLNPGNWTVTFDPATLNCNIPFFEICHIVINGAPGSSFSVFIDTFQWDTNQNGFANSSDPAVPLAVKPGQYVYFYWNDPVSDDNPPTVTVWIRYDQDIRANLAAVYGNTAV